MLTTCRVIQSNAAPVSGLHFGRYLTRGKMNSHAIGKKFPFLPNPNPRCDAHEQKLTRLTSSEEESEQSEGSDQETMSPLPWCEAARNSSGGGGGRAEKRAVGEECPKARATRA